MPEHKGLQHERPTLYDGSVYLLFCALVVILIPWTSGLGALVADFFLSRW